MAKNVLILCTGNSCRSVMAESILRKKGAGRFAAFSAGSKPAGRVNPNALAALARKNYPVEGFRSKSWDEFAAPGAPAVDYVVTVCSSAAGETCPVWIGAPVQAHWGIADPADVKGSPEEVRPHYDYALSLLEARVDAFVALDLENMSAADTRLALRKIGEMEGAA